MIKFNHFLECSQVSSVAIAWILTALTQQGSKDPERKCPGDCLSHPINSTVVANVLFLLLFFIPNKLAKMHI